MEWLTNNWVEICAALWAFDQFLKVIAPLTPTKIDDSISDYLGKILAKFFRKG
jgi:hypothetical protein